MILDSAIGVLVFLLLVVPGITYERVRERLGRSGVETGFREAARILLAGLILSSISAALLVLAGQFVGSLLPDFGAWLARPSGPDGYLVDNHGVVVRAVVVEVLLACLLAALLAAAGAWRRRRSGRPARYRMRSTWNTVFDTAVPKGKLPYVSARLTDGTRLSGYVRQWLTSVDGETGRLVLRGPNLTVKPRGADPIPIDDWDAVVLSLDEVAYLQVAYRDRADRSAGRRPDAGAGAAPPQIPTQTPEP